MVSIHAPTRGATHHSTLNVGRLTSFNPRTHTGCDKYCQQYTYRQVKVSIHAPTRGATVASMPSGYKSSSFNPRTHTGCDCS